MELPLGLLLALGKGIPSRRNPSSLGYKGTRLQAASVEPPRVEARVVASQLFFVLWAGQNHTALPSLLPEVGLLIQQGIPCVSPIRVSPAPYLVSKAGGTRLQGFGRAQHGQGKNTTPSLILDVPGHSL